jgi:hypothetical protein
MVRIHGTLSGEEAERRQTMSSSTRAPYHQAVPERDFMVDDVASERPSVTKSVKNDILGQPANWSAPLQLL